MAAKSWRKSKFEQIAHNQLNIQELYYNNKDNAGACFGHGSEAHKYDDHEGASICMECTTVKLNYTASHIVRLHSHVSHKQRFVKYTNKR